MNDEWYKPVEFVPGRAYPIYEGIPCFLTLEDGTEVEVPRRIVGYQRDVTPVYCAGIGIDFLQYLHRDRDEEE